MTVNGIRDLGVTFYNNLSFEKHMQLIFPPLENSDLLIVVENILNMLS